MLYPEFSQYKSIVDPTNPLTNHYLDKEGNSFYIEPGFYTAIAGYEDKNSKVVPSILKKMDELIKKNHKTIFTADFENPMVNKDDYIYVEITDITDPLHITWRDDNRRSAYGA